jgi:solute carrier family 35, member E1
MHKMAEAVSQGGRAPAQARTPLQRRPKAASRDVACLRQQQQRFCALHSDRPVPWRGARQVAAAQGNSGERRHGLKVTTVKPHKGLRDALQISALFAAWYSCNIYFNIFNKQVLTAFGHAATCTCLHLAVGSALAAALWLFRVRARPALTPRVLDLIFPLAILHALGFFTTNASLGAVAVSLTHTIKSMEPFFTVVLSWGLMAARPAKRVLAALVPIVIGVVVASATDISFNWLGFAAAMASNLAFQTRNVLSKKAMLRTSYESLEGGMTDISGLDEVNIFALMSMGACSLMLPFVAAFELPGLFAAAPNPADWMSGELWLKACLAGVCRRGAARLERLSN